MATATAKCTPPRPSPSPSGEREGERPLLSGNRASSCPVRPAARRSSPAAAAIRCCTPSTRSSRPSTASSCDSSSTRRWRSARWRQTTTLIVPSSSSRVTKITPLAVCGRWRTRHQAGDAHGAAVGDLVAARSNAWQRRAASALRSNDSGWRPERGAGQRVVGTQVLVRAWASAGASALPRRDAAAPSSGSWRSTPADRPARAMAMAGQRLAAHRHRPAGPAGGGRARRARTGRRHRRTRAAAAPPRCARAATLVETLDHAQARGGSPARVWSRQSIPACSPSRCSARPPAARARRGAARPARSGRACRSPSAAVEQAQANAAGSWHLSQQLT